MMTDSPTRPGHLPDYTNPPLTEVVLGVQFAPATGYQQIRAGEVWRLYQSEFPFVEEQQPLAPAFESFGLPFQANAVAFGLVAGAVHDRFWFVSRERDELIQFQQDRLMHNWRKVGADSGSYPRFENILPRFAKELEALESYFGTLAPQTLKCNQAEISYINLINLADGGIQTTVGKWIRILDFKNLEPDECTIVLRRALIGTNGKRYGRLTCELKSGPHPGGERAIVLALTVRGAPEEPSISSALELLKRGRDLIVEEFTSITTDSAHEIWGRVR
ncbi:MAG TPA: TIGR04255 family protein [Methylocystis sp.]|nr:TIGR04255 family protein [Methylocystis sp.]